MLTDLACRRAAASAKPVKMTDAHGLFLYVLPSGYKSWRWKYYWEGKEKRLVLGVYPALGLAAARKARDAARQVLREGLDPGVDRRRQAGGHQPRRVDDAAGRDRLGQGQDSSQLRQDARPGSE